MSNRLRVATRASKLALLQTRSVVAALLERDIRCDVVSIATHGDRVQDRSLTAIGGDGVFVKELELALVEGRADIAVHSMKDLPTDIRAEVDAGVVLPRADPRDVLLSRGNAFRTLAELPPHARVGTSSVRRAAQLLAARPDLDIVSLRGNVDTRVRKLMEGQYDAIVLALAGVTRLGILDEVGGGSPLAVSDMVPAVGQGAIFVQRRSDDDEARAAIDALNDGASAFAVSLERAFLRRMGGGCLVPVGAHVRVAGPAWRLDAFAAAADGSGALRRSHQSHATLEAEARRDVERVADDMLRAGAGAIIEQFRKASASQR